ncbi:hypothetical protein [Ktedonobacter sp. SOSP1-85]|nr:hypothetical protein [Ktedonobacter sp. SOSP1-85]
MSKLRKMDSGRKYLNIATDYLVFAAVGVGYHQTAPLLKRHNC